MTVDYTFQTLFAVPLSCNGCIKDVSEALLGVPGVLKVEGNLDDQLITVEGRAPPSTIVKAIQATGRDAILRGSGTSNNAAVSILETYAPHHDGQAGPAVGQSSADSDGTERDQNRFVRGLARLVQVSPDVTVIDLTVLGVAPGTYYVTVREFGDLKDGVLSAGPIWSGLGSNASADGSGNASGNPPKQRGRLGTVAVGPDGRGAVFLDQPIRVWEVIGHAFVVSPLDESQPETRLRNDENTVVGVVARSAGVWDNDKTVCSCSGKTLWQERSDEVKKGML